MTASPSEPGSKSFRVLMTADALGGVWRYSIDLIAGLVGRGAHVLLATMGPRASEQQRRQALEIPNVTLAESDFALEWMEHPWSDVDTAGRWLLDLEAGFGADLIHLNGYAHAVLNWQKPVLVMAHSCVNSWWRAVHGCAPGVEWNEYSRRVSAGLAAADAIVAPSAFMGAALEREYSISAGRTQIIHNFCSARRTGGVQKQPFILAAGRIWDQGKNIALFASIAPPVDWEIRVAGSNGGPGSSRTGHKGLRLEGALPYAELLAQMDRAAISAHPALYEPFGLSVLEAARARCCLVLSDITSLRELWDGAALFVNPRDPQRWTVELNLLARDRVKRQTLGDLAYARAGKYSATASLSKYWSLYSSLLDARHTTEKETAA